MTEVPGKSNFRVGYFVTVEVEAWHEEEAWIVGEMACGWPGDWSAPHTPVPVEGWLNGKKVRAKIVRSVPLMSKQAPEVAFFGVSEVEDS